MRLTGFTLALLPLLCWSCTLRDPCGPEGEAWRQCFTHHGATETEAERNESETVHLSNQ